MLEWAALIPRRPKKFPLSPTNSGVVLKNGNPRPMPIMYEAEQSIRVRVA